MLWLNSSIVNISQFWLPEPFWPFKDVSSTFFLSMRHYKANNVHREGHLRVMIKSANTSALHNSASSIMITIGSFAFSGSLCQEAKISISAVCTKMHFMYWQIKKQVYKLILGKNLYKLNRDLHQDWSSQSVSACYIGQNPFRLCLRSSVVINLLRGNCYSVSSYLVQWRW